MAAVNMEKSGLQNIKNPAGHFFMKGANVNSKIYYSINMFLSPVFEFVYSIMMIILTLTAKL